MKIIYLILFLCVMVSGQNTFITKKPFATADTVGSITLSDSVEIQFNDGGQWKLLTSSLNDTALITGDDKVAEQRVQFTLSSESFWTLSKQVRFRIYSTGVDTITSSWVNVGGLNGACLLDVKPDTVGTNTFYFDTEFQGN